MPRYVKNNERRWLHPSYRKAYCYCRENGIVYTVVNSVRKSTGLIWSPQNKKKALIILEQRIQQEVFNVKIYQPKTIMDLVKQFHKDRVIKLDKSTQYKYKRLYKDFFLEDLSLDDVQMIRMKIIERKSKLNLAPSTLRKKLSMLRSIFKYAIELEWMDKNPITPSMLTPVPKKEVKLITSEHIAKIKEYFEEKKRPEMSLIMEFAYLTGMRIQEMIDLQWDDVTDRYFVIKGKGDNQRIFPLKPFPRVKEILDELRKMGYSKPIYYKFQQPVARQLKKAIIELDKRFPEMKFAGITFHVIRKGTINHWRSIGIDTELRNMLAGHTREVERMHYLVVPDIDLLENRLMKQ